VRWIWLGSLFMAAAGLLAAGDRRYWKRSAREQTSVSSTGEATS